MIPSASSNRLRDSRQSLPNQACSIGATPRPTPKSSRPPVSWSATHMSSRIWTGWCSGSSFTIGPIRIFVVTCEAAAMNSSWLGAMHRSEPWCSARWKPVNPASSASLISSRRSWKSRWVGVPGMSSMWSKMPKVGVATMRNLYASKDQIERPGHDGQVERVHEQRRVADLPVAHPPPQLLLVRPLLLRRLLLEGSERSELALSVRDLLDGGDSERTDELVLQVGGADVETQLLHIGPAEIRAEARALEAAPEVVL